MVLVLELGLSTFAPRTSSRSANNLTKAVTVTEFAAFILLLGDGIRTKAARGLHQSNPPSSAEISHVTPDANEIAIRPA